MPLKSGCTAGRDASQTSVGLTTVVQRTAVVATVNANSLSAVYEAWPIRFQVEYSSQAGRNTGYSDQKLTCYLEWLGSQDAEAVRSGNAKIFDVELLEGDMSMAPDELETFYIYARGTLLRIRVI